MLREIIWCLGKDCNLYKKSVKKNTKKAENLKQKIFKHKHTHRHTNTDTFMHTQTFPYTNRNTYTYTYTHPYAYTYTSKYTFTSKYTYTYTYTFAYTYIHIKWKVKLGQRISLRKFSRYALINKQPQRIELKAASRKKHGTQKKTIKFIINKFNCKRSENFTNKSW